MAQQTASTGEIGENSGAKGELQKKTDWKGAFMIGLAGTILVTGVAPFAVQSMGAASIPLFFVVTGIGVFLCFCLAELAAMMPHRAGGLPSYAYETFKSLGPNFAKHVGGISAWGYGLGWFPVAPINMILAASYIASLLGLPSGTTYTPISAPITTTVAIIAVVGLLLLFIPCYRGINLGAGFATFFGIVSMVPLTLLVLLPFFKPGVINWGNVAGFHLVNPDQPQGLFAFYISWIFILTWNVLAMEAAACYIGECRNPVRDAKIALGAEGLYGYFIYLATPLMLVAVLGSTQTFDPLTVFLTYTQAIFGDAVWVQWLIGIPLIAALLLSVLNALMGCGRSLYQVAHDGVLPKFFEHTNSHGVPDNAMLFNLVASIIVVFFGSPFEIYIFSNIGYLLACALALIGYFLYRQFHPELKRPVRMPEYFKYIALILGIFFLFVWVYGGYYASDIAVAAGKRWLFFLGLAIMLLYIPFYLYRRAEDRRAGEAVLSAGGK
ncbi:MAG: APC family permease [Chloroflexi bacterium]|nr:APC family permease [Chloroflexota bacterium]